MKKIYLVAVLLILVSIRGNSFFAKDAKKVENFRLKDYNGKEIQLSDFKNSKATVIIFISTQCPVSNAYNERMAKLYADYSKKGIAFLGINSNASESTDEIKRHSEEHKFGFPVLKDNNNFIADKFDASVTPEAYVINENMELFYHGRIDDNRRTENVEVKDLSLVLDEILAGKSVSYQKTKAFGCSIKRVK